MDALAFQPFLREVRGALKIVDDAIEAAPGAPKDLFVHAELDAVRAAGLLDTAVTLTRPDAAHTAAVRASEHLSAAAREARSARIFAEALGPADQTVVQRVEKMNSSLTTARGWLEEARVHAELPLDGAPVINGVDSIEDAAAAAGRAGTEAGESGARVMARADEAQLLKEMESKPGGLGYEGNWPAPRDRGSLAKAMRQDGRVVATSHLENVPYRVRLHQPRHVGPVSEEAGLKLLSAAARWDRQPKMLIRVDGDLMIGRATLGLPPEPGPLGNALTILGARPKRLGEFDAERIFRSVADGAEWKPAIPQDLQVLAISDKAGKVTRFGGTDDTIAKLDDPPPPLPPFIPGSGPHLIR